MSCSSAIYTVNDSGQIVNNGSIVSLGSTIRRYGRNLAQSGNGILVGGRGYYDVTGTITLAPVAAGVVGVQLVADGLDIPGAYSEVTGTADTIVTLPVQGLFRMTCCEQPSNIQVKLIGDDAVTSASVTNCNLVIKKI